MNTNSDMLYSIVLILTPTREVVVRQTMGHYAHAALLRTVRESDPALAQVLHLPHLPIRPFTVSMLQGTSEDQHKWIRLSPQETYWLRFTVLYQPIFERFMARFLRGEGRPVIRLGRAVLLIKEILTTPGSHPWAGYTSWEKLVSEAKPDQEITLDFASPTAFGFGQKEWGKKVMVLPVPETVFDSLARSWNALAPASFNMNRQELRDYLDEHVVITHIEGLRTRMLDFGRSLQVGFVGRVTYGLMAEDEALRCQLNILANFAFYAGVGMKTTMGMGQTRRVVR